MTGGLRATLVTLAIAALGAALFQVLGLPAPFLTGPALCVTVAGLARVPICVPPPLRDTVFLLIGVSIGTSVTPETLATALDWPLSFLGLTLSLLFGLRLCRLYLERVCGFDRRGSLLAATPGHLSYVLSLSEDTGTDPTRVALIQSMRVLLLTLMVPLILSLLGLDEGSTASPTQAMGPLSLGLVLCGSLLAGLAMKRAQVPAALLLGGMAASSFSQVTGLIEGGLPWLLGPAAFAVMGALIGTRFAGRSMAEIMDTLRAGVGVTLIACLAAAAAAFGVGAILDLSPALLLISFAPGGVEAMAAMAILIGADPTFVAGHHVFRLVILLAIVPILMRRARLR